MKRIKEHYVVNVVGEVFSLHSKGKMSLKVDRRGYPTVKLRGVKTYSVHRLVAEAYVPNPNKLPTVNHINGIKDDNRVENLEWMSFEDNYTHAVDNGFVTRWPSISKRRQVWLCELYRGGRSVVGLSNLAGVSQVHIKRVLEWYGVYEENRSYFKVDYTEICDLIKTGLFTSKELALLFGYTYVMINKIKRDNGLEGFTYYRDEMLKSLCNDEEDITVWSYALGLNRGLIRQIAGVEYIPKYEYGVKDLQLLEKYVKQGRGRSEIKLLFSCGDKALDTALNRAGVEINRRKYNYDEIKRLREGGLSYAQVAEIIGAPTGTVTGVCQRNGWGGVRAEVGYPSHR